MLITIISTKIFDLWHVAFSGKYWLVNLQPVWHVHTCTLSCGGDGVLRLTV